MTKNKLAARTPTYFLHVVSKTTLEILKLKVLFEPVNEQFDYRSHRYYYCPLTYARFHEPGWMQSLVRCLYSKCSLCLVYTFPLSQPNLRINSIDIMLFSSIRKSLLFINKKRRKFKISHPERRRILLLKRSPCLDRNHICNKDFMLIWWLTTLGWH